VTERRHLAQVTSSPGSDAHAAAGSALSGVVDDGIDSLAEELALPDDGDFDGAGMTLYHATGVRFEVARILEHDGGDVSYARGDRVVCETSTGLVWGEVAVPSRRVLLRSAPPRILRRASAGDIASEAHVRAREQEVWKTTKAVASALQLPVKVVRAEALQGGAKFVVYFASESKTSFREWLRGIGARSREKVELRQIGMRDAARLIGGVGPCGLQLCCNTFLSDFTPVGIKMAKTQGLTLNPQKVSGMCGRLLCCLVYEEAHYRAGRLLLPEPGEVVSTESGRGRVREVDVLQMRVSVALERGETQTFAAADVTRIDGERRRVE